MKIKTEAELKKMTQEELLEYIKSLNQQMNQEESKLTRNQKLSLIKGTDDEFYESKTRAAK